MSAVVIKLRDLLVELWSTRCIRSVIPNKREIISALLRPHQCALAGMGILGGRLTATTDI